MRITEWMSTPADLYAMALEVGAAWDEGAKEARDVMKKADEMKAKAKGR